MLWYPRYSADYQRATAGLSLIEHGVVSVLLDTYYVRELPLPADLAALERIAGVRTDVERRALRRVVDAFFPIAAHDGLRHSARADREIAAYHERVEKNRANGRRGGRPAKATAEPTAKATAKPIAKPIAKPTAQPTGKPTAHPTAEPNAKASYSDSYKNKPEQLHPGTPPQSDTPPKANRGQAKISAATDSQRGVALSVAGPVPLGEILAEAQRRGERRGGGRNA